jgi:hypothetical protein
MTDRFNALTVVLENDIRVDDAHPLLAAIAQIRGVLSVDGEVADLASHIAEVRAKHELGVRVWKAIYPDHPAGE